MKSCLFFLIPWITLKCLSIVGADFKLEGVALLITESLPDDFSILYSMLIRQDRRLCHGRTAYLAGHAKLL